MEETTDYIGEEEQQVMVNYRVDDPSTRAI